MKFHVGSDKLALIGDIHGEFRTFNHLVKEIPDDYQIIQIGDFGYWPKLKYDWHNNKPDRIIYFIDGNHEYFPDLPRETDRVTEVWHGLYHIPRGTELVFPGGMNAVCIGGGDSVDYKLRQLGKDLFKEEEVTPETIERIINSVFSADLIISHSPPKWIVDKYFDSASLVYRFGADPQWESKSQPRIEKLYNRLGRPPLVCGHMHKSIIDGNVRILDINEVYYHEWR